MRLVMRDMSISPSLQKWANVIEVFDLGGNYAIVPIVSLLKKVTESSILKLSISSLGWLLLLNGPEEGMYFIKIMGGDWTRRTRSTMEGRYRVVIWDELPLHHQVTWKISQFRREICSTMGSAKSWIPGYTHHNRLASTLQNITYLKWSILAARTIELYLLD